MLLLILLADSDEEEDNSQDSEDEDYSDDDNEGNTKGNIEKCEYSDIFGPGLEDYKKGGYHPVYVGDIYNNGKYLVEEKLGWGHFSTVWLVR